MQANVSSSLCNDPRLYIATGYGRLNEYTKLKEGKKREQNLVGMRRVFIWPDGEFICPGLRAVDRDVIVLTRFLARSVVRGNARLQTRLQARLQVWFNLIRVRSTRLQTIRAVEWCRLMRVADVALVFIRPDGDGGPKGGFCWCWPRVAEAFAGPSPLQFDPRSKLALLTEEVPNSLNKWLASYIYMRGLL